MTPTSIYGLMSSMTYYSLRVNYSFMRTPILKQFYSRNFLLFCFEGIMEYKNIWAATRKCFFGMVWEKDVVAFSMRSLYVSKLSLQIIFLMGYQSLLMCLEKYERTFHLTLLLGSLHPKPIWSSWWWSTVFLKQLTLVCFPPYFLSKFWQESSKLSDTKLRMSTAYHP